VADLLKVGRSTLYRALAGSIGRVPEARPVDVRVGDGGLQSCEIGKNFDVSDQEQVIDRTGIGDDELHPSESQPFKASDLTADVFKGVVDPDVVGFQESVELAARTEAEQAS
jgi:hypothetical protein